MSLAGSALLVLPAVTAIDIPKYVAMNQSTSE